MTDPTSTDSPIEAAAEIAGERAIEAFSLLGNETRLAILLALWEAHDPWGSSNAVSFSELQSRVGIRDSGQFNYHLDKLEGRFVEKFDEGYELRRAGHKIVKAVIAGAGLDDITLGLTELNLECSLCGGPTAIGYEDEILYLRCLDCVGFYGEGGYFGESTELPRGFLAGYEMDPAALHDRTAEQVWQAGHGKMLTELLSATHGVCPSCSGPIERTVDVCKDHQADGICKNCGERYAAMARFSCPVCKYPAVAPPRTIVILHPVVIAFYQRLGIDVQYELTEFADVRRHQELTGKHKQTVQSIDPILVNISIEHEGDRLELTVNENLSVVEVS